MKWLTTKNNKPVNLKDIPLLEFKSFRGQIIKHVKSGMRPVLFFAEKRAETHVLFIVLADDDNSGLYISSGDLGSKMQYQSISMEIPGFWNFENEIHEESGIIPEGHPWPRPVRFSSGNTIQTRMEQYPFFKMQGEEVHEVAVGPIHAGIIEPGHFRFMCQGENVHHLEIQLGYQHRGVEKLILKNNLKFPVHLAESIAGDSVIAHCTAYAQAMEALAGVEISRRAQAIRAIALEMERAGIHIGDLAAIANDVAYLLGNAVFGATRTLVINSLLTICGSRFGRGLIRAGGVAFDITDELKTEIKQTLTKVLADVERMGNEMFSSASVLSRLEETGIVNKEKAMEIGLVGLPARASGISLDVRSDHPFGIYRYYPVHKVTMDSGDVFARSYLRFVEIKKAIKFITEQLDNLPAAGSLITPVKKLQENKFVVSMTEGWRGETAHAVITGHAGSLTKYRIKDPSFHNWLGLAQAVRNNGISDFPLCNKSFNLSYCGHDL
ncbi:MAG: hydrogenase [Spirochaetes bacterium]|nr:hydrogenase [Spirochaetota bacterium]